MAKIKMNLEELRKCSGTLEQKKKVLEGLNERFQKLISDIGSSWEGDASLSYIGMLGSYLSKTAQMIAIIEEMKNYVDSATSAFAELDEKSAQKIEGINF